MDLVSRAVDRGAATRRQRGTVLLIPTSAFVKRCSCFGCCTTGSRDEQAAEVVGVGRATVQRYVAAFREGGLDGLRQWNVNRPVSEMAAYRELIRESFEKQPACTVAEAGERIFQLTGLRRGPSQVRKFLKDLGLKWQRVRAIPVPPKKTWPSTSKPKPKFLDTELKPLPGRRPSGTRSRVLRGRGPFRVRDILVLPVVVHADLRPRSVGSSAVQCLGCVERGDAATDRRDQHHGRQHRDDVRTVAEDRRLGADRTDHAGAGQRPLSTQRRGARRWRSSWGSRCCSCPRTRPT